MSKLHYSKGKFLLQDGDQSDLILDTRTYLANKSRVHSHQLNQDRNVEFQLDILVCEAAKKIFKKTPTTLAELVTYLRIIAQLLRKPQIHNVLHVGKWSQLDEELAKILPKFNPVNKLYCLSETRPLGRMPSVTFMFAEGGEYLLPEDKFDTIIFPANQPPLEVLLAVKTHGKIYFAAQNVEESLRAQAKRFPLTSQATLFELTITPQLRQELKQRTPQGRLADKKAEIIQVVDKLPGILKKRNSRLDEYIAEVILAEKLLAEIFPELHSDTIKFNFNLLKEFLIDLRLGNGSITRLSRQYEVLMQDLSDS